MTNCSNSNGNSSDCSSSSSSSSSSSIGNLNGNGNNSKTNSVSLNQSTSPNGGAKSSSTDNAAMLSTQQSSQATEKPAHYTYLKGFRVEQCSLFLQHKCTQHRPYTCFYWHFKNQRRRRPLRKRDGTFNYNPDTYCEKYDEQSGVCSNSDECPYVHRNAGDTEKRYHLRYYKTATCIHETDTKGNCSKNGVHCAFAHGAADMRPPVYDIRELQLQQAQLSQQQQSSSLSVSSVSSSSSNSQQHNQSNINSINGVNMNGGLVPHIGTNGLGEQFGLQNSPGNNGDLMNEKTLNLSTSLEKERLLNEDPKWNETSYVLTNYKTEQCRRPPRLCRQGFACPQYHNARDKRRNPNLFKYRSTPCPNVKQGDDWLEPTVCDNGDLCKYCHSRTEQQFHPEIYKSSKCNDMNTTGYCPRGPFCAFAHIEQELKNQRAHSNSESSNSDYTLENFISNALPSKEPTEHEQQQEVNGGAGSNYNQNDQHEYTSYIEIVNQNNESSSSTNSLNSHTIQNGGGGSCKSNSLVTQVSSTSSSSTSAAQLLQQQMLAAANNAYTCKPIGSEREKPKGSQMPVQQMQQNSQQGVSQQSKQIINETDTTNLSSNTAQLNLNNNNGSSNSNQAQQVHQSNTTTSNSSTNTNNNNNQNLLNEIDNCTIEKLRHDLFRQAEVSNKLETLCLQYRQWVEKLTIDVNEWKSKYSRCDSEKKNLELQLFNKQCLEQNIAPLRNANFNLNGNSNDLIDGNDLTKLLNFNSNNTNLIQNTSLNNNNNNINSINKK